ncbi:MAG: hypothetical protein SPJ28_08335 [Oscillospiraceae bacterium]|nr:hypothetical protein [Oscillospiraceae bacterium]
MVTKKGVSVKRILRFSANLLFVRFGRRLFLKIYAHWRCAPLAFRRKTCYTEKTAVSAARRLTFSALYRTIVGNHTDTLLCHCGAVRCPYILL